MSATTTPMLGVRTLFSKEVRRFMRVYGQTIASPLITTSLYFVVFGYSIGHRVGTIEGVSYARFMVPGLVALGVIQNAFLNTSSSFFMMKLMGTITDLLVTPLTYGEILSGFISAAVLRALMVGALMWLVAALFTGFAVANPLFVIAMLVLISVAFSSLGLCVAIWAEQFEQVNFVPTFVITPLTFLGGVFYSASMLPPALRKFTLVNPLFYMVDGVRWGMLGISDTSPWVGMTFVLGLATVCIGAALWMLRSGWKLRG